MKYFLEWLEANWLEIILGIGLLIPICYKANFFFSCPVLAYLHYHIFCTSIDKACPDICKDKSCHGSIHIFRRNVRIILVGQKQTPDSVMDTVDYCRYLLDKFKGNKRLTLFIGPLAPFLDPGSLAFEQPERYGYRVLFRTLEEHRQALLAPSWRYTLNYETEWMTRQQIMDTTYEAIRRLTRLKAKYSFISREMAEIQEQRITTALELERRIDAIWCRDNHRDELDMLKSEMDKINALRATERLELELPTGLTKLRFLSSLWSLVTARR